MERIKVFVIGGYGYRNVGDEGQLSGNLESLMQYLDNPKIVVATPDVSYSRSIHTATKFVEALRSCFFKQHETRRFQIVNRNKKSFVRFLGNEAYKFRFILDSLVLIFDCILSKYNIPIRLVNRKTRDLVREIRSSDILFFSGGGYLTEPTLSRLWDGFLHIAIARLFGVRVVMSGQTIGPIDSNFNRLIAKWLFTKCFAISLRDGKKSVEFFDSIGVSESYYDVVCDDATFCTTSQQNDNIPYVAYQFHYWGAVNASVSKDLLIRNVEIVNYILSKGINVKLVSMTPSDESPLLELYNHVNHINLELSNFEYSIDYVVGLYKNAQFTVTMKHHPIVFSIGQTIPVIALNFSDYYHHKNGGALSLFGLDEFGIDIFTDIGEIFKLIDRLFDAKERFLIKKNLFLELSIKANKRKKFFMEILP